MLKNFLFLVVVNINCLYALSQGWTPQKVFSMEYPGIAASARIEGRIKLTCRIGENGNVLSAEAQKRDSVSPQVLVKAAQDNIFQWKFRHERCSDVAKGEFFEINYEFKLGKPAKDSQHIHSSFIYEYPNLVVIEAETPSVM